jgi:hypothetical protein
MKIITELTKEMKDNLSFEYYFYNSKDLFEKTSDLKIGHAAIVSHWKFHFNYSTEVYIFDGYEWCKYDVPDIIFEADTFDRIGQLPHPSGKGTLCILYNNTTDKKTSYFLVFHSEDGSGYWSKGYRKCRIYTYKPEYLIGYDENCKLTKAERDVFINILNPSNDMIRENNNRRNGWDLFSYLYNDNHRYIYIPFINQCIRGPIRHIYMPNYNLLETED